jgi:hypothetical protein
MVGYSQQQGKWGELQIEGPMPAGRGFCRMIICEELVFLYGGALSETEFDGNLYCLDMNEHKWTIVPLAGDDEDDEGKSEAPGSVTPPARCGHTMSMWHTSIVLFGGVSEEGKYLNDAWMLDTTPLHLNPPEPCNWVKINVSDSFQPPAEGGSVVGQKQFVPPPRDNHCATVCNDHLYIFGGTDQTGADLTPPGEVESFGLINKEWQMRVATGTPPVINAGASAHTLGNTGKILVITSEDGGIFNCMAILDTADSSLLWSPLKAEWRGDWTMIPGSRQNHCAELDVTGGYLFVFGGESEGGDGGTQLHNMLLVLDCASLLGIKRKDDGDGDDDDGKSDEGGSGGENADLDEDVEEPPEPTGIRARLKGIKKQSVR